MEVVASGRLGRGCSRDTMFVITSNSQMKTKHSGVLLGCYDDDGGGGSGGGVGGGVNKITSNRQNKGRN